MRLFICIILLVFSAPARGEEDDICVFLNRVSPSQLYSNNKKLAAAFERELTWIKAAHERRRNPAPGTTKRFKSSQDGGTPSPGTADNIHPPEFVEKVRSLVREDYQREGIEFDENVTGLEYLLHPHKRDPLRVKEYKGTPKPSGPSTSSDDLFASLYILTDDGILTEAGILVAAAAEFWLYGVPRNSLESYEADSQQYLSRLGFINHDEYHRFLTISQLEHRLKGHRFGTNLQISPLPTRVRNLLSNLKLDKQLINDMFAFIHERYWDYLDN